MKHHQYELTITLIIRGPFISSSGTDAARGLDLMFGRDAHGELILRGSHVKGKLREAMQELDSAQQLKDFTLTTYFGEPADNELRPHRGILCFHDFTRQKPVPQETKRQLTRVCIDTESGTAKENALVSIEHWFQTGTASVWTGTIDFFAPDSATAENIRQNVLLGLKWITRFGAMKGSGYGRLEQVSAELQPVEVNPVYPAASPATDTIRLRFNLKDDLLIGGITRGSNYLESCTIIPGGVVKGALARFLNDLCGSREPTVTADNAEVKTHFPELATYFERLRISHAFPARPGAASRPQTIPFSTVKDSHGTAWDLAVALGQSDTPPLNSDKSAPTYRIDWKDDADVKNVFGWAPFQFSNITRTAIESETRTAQEEQLYTFQYLSPNADTGEPLDWLAEIRLPEAADLPDEVFAKLQQQLVEALNAGWRYLGKRDSRFQLQAAPGPWPQRFPQHPDGVLTATNDPAVKQAIIVLQTDALLFDWHVLSDGEADAAVQAERLRQLYAEYWAEVTGQTCEMVGYLARQTMAGGYLVKRFQPDADYYPYILTEAGSVFIVQTRAPDAEKYLARLEQEGLPLPKAVQNRVRRPGKALWECCPFTPEDGFGEICMNSDWHWHYQQHLSKGDDHDRQ